jgi:acyl-CoA thioester hydrolase
VRLTQGGSYLTSHSLASQSQAGKKARTEHLVVAETTFHVRYAETDQMGIVHHSAYIIWFEEGRSAWSRQIGRPYADFERCGHVLAVTEVGARYIAPARYDQEVTVRTWVSQVRSRLIRFEYEVLDTPTGRLLVNGFTAHICLDRQGKPARIPEDWQRLWAGSTPTPGTG